MGVSAGTTTATTTIPSYEPLRRDSFRPPSLEAADNSLGLTSSLSPVDEQVSDKCQFSKLLGLAKLLQILVCELGLTKMLQNVDCNLGCCKTIGFYARVD